MDSATLQEIRKLFTRLKDANKQADMLRNEVNSISKEIQVLSKNEVFKRHINNSSSSDEGDSSPPSKKRVKYDFMKSNGYVIVYTDGACENNGKANAKAGLGVWFGENHPLNLSKPVKGKATNNVGEIQACIWAVKIAKQNSINKLKIHTDSQFTINSMTKWIHNWKKNNWKLAGGKSDVKNKEDFKELDKLCQTIDIKWEYVPGHQGVRGNEEADRLAREGAKLYKVQT